MERTEENIKMPPLKSRGDRPPLRAKRTAFSSLSHPASRDSVCDVSPLENCLQTFVAINFALPMLPKNNRLRKKKDIEQVLKRGRALKEDFLVLKTLQNNLDKARFGFIVSLKVSKKATLRNKVRRKLSELVRLDMERIKPGSDNLLIAAPGLAVKDFWEMKESLDKLFSRAKLFRR